MLFLAEHPQLPSHLWMRRMLRSLGGELSVLACEEGDESLVAAGVDVHLIHGHKPSLRSRVSHLLGVSGDPPYRQEALRRLSRQMARADVKVALVHFLSAAVSYLPVWRETKKPVVIHCHGADITFDGLSHDSPNTPFHPPDYWSRVCQLPGNVRFIANSEHTRSLMVDAGMPSDRIDIKYLGVEVSEWTRCYNRDRPLKVLFLGRLVDFKGPVEVVQAFDLACRRGFAGDLTVAGDGPLRRQCEAAALQSRFADRIRFTGVVCEEQGGQLRRESDVFTAHNMKGPASGQQEAFGVSIIEAMQDYMPVVTGASGGPRETVRHGQDGLLVQPGDIAGHADALLSLDRDRNLLASMGEAARKRVQDCFTIDREMIRLREILAEAEKNEPCNA